MSNPKTAIQEIKKLMVQFGFLSDEPVMASFKTEDNTILETFKLEVGSKITKLNDEFERVALESGKYRLVENFEIQVKNGTITSVKQIFVDAKLADGTQIKVEGDGLMEGSNSYPPSNSSCSGLPFVYNNSRYLLSSPSGIWKHSSVAECLCLLNATQLTSMAGSSTKEILSIPDISSSSSIFNSYILSFFILLNINFCYFSLNAYIWIMEKAFDANYIINSDGRVWSVRRQVFLKPQKRGKYRNYFFVNLNGRVYSLHRLIAETFIPNPNNYPQVNHKNTDTFDNRVQNLEWCTNRQNVIHFHNSKFPGVQLKPSGKFSARVRILKESFYLGTYKTAEEAYKVITSFLGQHTS